MESGVGWDHRDRGRHKERHIGRQTHRETQREPERETGWEVVREWKGPRDSVGEERDIVQRNRERGAEMEGGGR